MGPPPERMKISCDKYVEKVLKNGDIQKSIEFCKERKTFYRSAISRNELNRIDKHEAIIQIKKLSYIIAELSRSLNDGDPNL